MKQIKTLAELEILALEKKSVIVKMGGFGSKRIIPAAFVINWQGHFLLHLFQSGIYVYEKAKR